MHSTHLEIFTEIKGIGAASGLFLHRNLLYIIGDNSGNLNEYNIKTKELKKIQILFDKNLNQLDNIAKVQKPDFEALCYHENKLYILGSGSTIKRNLMIEFDLFGKKVVERDLKEVYSKLQEISKIDDKNFNIEGAIFTGDEWLLFNRGNGFDSKNGIFIIRGQDLVNGEQIRFLPIKLPNIDHVESSFTDAVLLGNEIFFISTAEDTKSTYTDGEILGSFIGSLNKKTMELNFTHRISSHQKFEGISVLNQDKGKIEFLLCEDRDTDELKTIIYKLSLSN
ncbi:hypothetical protein EZ449_20615 [Pedobacter frigidisoli]|uniref:Uncharacterized protein n=1 Tax=Pedobacter frigidisoli TaxID=2530455 RepID=A0A4R0NMT3_9SPHI|nr:hypothetical protein [Pedobacter frigidisoli]TCD00564.1 hypothetical protein EZ449_20615 [Pedobacter frigidisoli]